MKTNNTPRIVMTINDDNVTIKGNYIDKNARVHSLHKVFNDELQAQRHINNMRDNEEFSLQINRINWKL
jgi:hypothetical protein